MQFIDLKAQYEAYKSEIDAAIAEAVASIRFINGPQVSELEQQMADYVGVKYAVGLSSGTDALLAPLMAWGIGPGDEVITTPFTFIATAEVVALTGATPVFVDIEPDTLNIDPNQIEAAITPRTKAIIAVGLYGQCADMDAVQAIADKHGLKVIEDAAQSMGAEYKGRRSGSLGHVAGTSFFPAKPLGGMGDGGMAFTNDEELAKTMRMIKEHGQTAHYRHGKIGINGRLDTIQAAILLVKLKYFDDEIAARQKVAQYYMDNMPDGARGPVIREGNLSAFAQFTVRVPQRDKVVELIRETGVPIAVHYPLPLNRQPIFLEMRQKAGLEPETFANAELAANEVMSLPMHPFMQQADQDTVLNAIKEALGKL
ncbi:DegT/DnrJ/EryC1/StrS family aminotransferase [Magnetofaba australis]|uniref:Putative DegT/DnrJ/EryC1/StrS aminotransferase n=1 Tax=Magnetofaba australis IT-1 TaxID=1434232 RepID=A0A1Y2K753_9PROT|nr:DegT/DnrJ/EryC1/StrS family aminotransferase [Magnetofaba australis]OSM06124.1 putative DegT/DnrJ/EryC1/StrS aminotransferase [Magnetofaba australis IT-1]